MALYADDSYLNKPAREPIERIILYVKSMARFGNSPYIFPLYGLGELPERFSFLSAVYGGTYALNTPLQEILYGDDGKVSGVRFPHPITKVDTIVKTKKVIADPTYFLCDENRIRKVGQLVRAICVLQHPVEGTDNAESAQIIIPASQMGRKNDIYISVLSSAFNVCPKGFYLASVSTMIENTDSGNPHSELEPGFERLGLASGRLGEREEKFIQVVDLYEPVEDGTRDNVFISRSYDATTHFETCTGMLTRVHRTHCLSGRLTIPQTTSRTSTSVSRARTWSSRRERTKRRSKGTTTEVTVLSFNNCRAVVLRDCCVSWGNFTNGIRCFLMIFFLIFFLFILVFDHC